MAKCIKKSVPSLIDGMLKKYSTVFSQYERVRILAFDPAMKNMGVTSFVMDGIAVDEILEEGGDNVLQDVVEKGLEIEYASRVNLGISITEDSASFLDVMNVVYSTNGFLETLVETLTGFQEVDSTLILIEKQPDVNYATNKIFETIFGFFCNPKYKNALVPGPKVVASTLVEPEGQTGRIKAGSGTESAGPLGMVAVIPLEGYSKNGITLYREELERKGSVKANYRQNKHDTKEVFLQYCANTGLMLPGGKKDAAKVDDIADSFCMTVFVVGKLLAYSQL